MILKEENIKIDLLEGNTEPLRKGFKVQDFYPSYEIVTFKCIGEDGTHFHIKINNEIFYVIRSNIYINYISNKEYLINKLTEVPVGRFLQVNPNSNSKKIEVSSESTFAVVEVNGDWVKLKSSDLCDDLPSNLKNKEGWIKWIDSFGNILLDIYFFC